MEKPSEMFLPPSEMFGTTLPERLSCLLVQSQVGMEDGCWEMRKCSEVDAQLWELGCSVNIPRYEMALSKLLSAGRG